jgi:AraC family transcriptional regulator
MSWQDVSWNISLQSPPRIVDAGLAVHGLPVERFRHPHLWAVHFHRYSANLTMAGEVFPLRPHHVTVVQPDTQMEFHFQGRSPHLYVLFLLENSANRVLIPAMQNLGRRFSLLDAEMEFMLGFRARQPERAHAMLWNVLWKLTEAAAQDKPGFHRAVENACQIIETQLSQPLRVARIAEEVGISHNHLTRLFQQNFGTTVIGYIQERRLQRARHLLQHSTRPIKAIAGEIGAPDVQTFNKTMRRLCGGSPRQIRAKGTESVK